jgi:hypothetical protein
MAFGLLSEEAFLRLSPALPAVGVEDRIGHGMRAADEAVPQSIDHSNEGLGAESVARLNQLAELYRWRAHPHVTETEASYMTLLPQKRQCAENSESKASERPSLLSTRNSLAGD